MEHETKDGLVTELMRLVDAYGDACTSWPDTNAPLRQRGAVLAVDDITNRPSALQYGDVVHGSWRLNSISGPDCFVAIPLPYSGDLS